MDEQGAQAMGEKDTVCGSRHTVQTRVGTRCMSHETLLAATDNGMIFCERSRASAEQTAPRRRRAARSSTRSPRRRDRISATISITGTWHSTQQAV